MILIGTPCYSGSVTVNYMVSLFNMVNTLTNHGITADITTPAHESLITRVRNYIANEFLRQKDYTHLLFIDADMGFEPDTALRYLQADKDVVCGIYPTKCLDIDRLRQVPPEVPALEAEAATLGYTVKLRAGEEVDEHGLVRVEYGSTGFMLIRRRVLEEMVLAYPDLKYHYAYATTYDHVYDNYAFFDTAIDPATREYLPEDYAFCKRWTDLGGEVHADTRSRFSHAGGRIFTGNYPQYLAHMTGKKKG